MSGPSDHLLRLYCRWRDNNLYAFVFVFLNSVFVRIIAVFNSSDNTEVLWYPEPKPKPTFFPASIRPSPKLWGFSAVIVCTLKFMPSVLWHCWLHVRKGNRPIKIWLMRCWHGRLLERSANSCIWFSWWHCHCHPIMSASAKSRMVYPSGTDTSG